jgi:hypothetical protein
MTPVKNVNTESSVGYREFYDDEKTYLRTKKDFLNRVSK